MACPKFDRTNKKHVIIAASVVAAAVVLLIVISVVAVVLVKKSSDCEGEGGWRKAVLEAHNEIRKKHHADPLTLSCDLNERAEKCAKYYAEEVGDIDHSCRFKDNAGENLHQSIGRVPEHVKPKDKQAIYGLERMYREVHNFDFSNPNNNKLWNTGHFTQMVWKGSKEFGVGVYHKEYDGYSVYLYSPAGNNGNYDSSNVEKE